MEPDFVLPASDDPWVTLAAVGVQTGANPWWQALLTAGSMIVVVNSVLAGVVGGLLWRSVAGPSGPLALALAAAVGFLGSLVSQGIYGQRAFRRELEASTVAFPAGPAGKDPADGGVRRDQQTDPEGQQPHRPADGGQQHQRAGRLPAMGLERSDELQPGDPQQRGQQLGLDEGDAGQRASQSGEQVAKVLADCHPRTSGPPGRRPIA
jgi:hypothetical protein